MEIQEKKRLPKSTKVCIIIMTMMLIAAGIGGYFLYDYASGQGYHSGYQDAYDSGYEIGWDEGYDEALTTIEELYYESQNKSGNTSQGYLTTDTAPSGTVWTTPAGEKYHEPGCRYIAGRHDLTYFDSAQDAINAGFEPCSVCH